MKHVLALALASVAGTSLAGMTLAGMTLAAPPIARPVQNAMQRFPGVSDSGNAIINEGNRSDPQLDGISRQVRSVHDQLSAAVSGSAVDVDRVSALLRQGDNLQAQGRQRVTERIIATARQLSVADRAAFLRDLLMPPPGAAQR